MYRSIRFILVNAACLLLCATAYGQVRINEVGYSGVDFQGASKWVELHNTDSSDVDVSSFWLCNFPNYTQIANLTALQGSTTIPAGGFLVVALDALGEGDGEVGLYQDIGGDFGNFGRAGFMLDYMQYGSAGHQRESVAVADGVWDAGTFGPAAANGQSLAFLGGGATTAEAWQSSIPTPGSANPADPATAIEPIDAQIPSGFALHGNYPNPFNPKTTIQYEMDTSGRVTLSVYNVLGEKVVDLVDAAQTSGVYRVTWDGRDARGYLVASGLYLYRLMLNGRQSQVRTLTLLK